MNDNNMTTNKKKTKDNTHEYHYVYFYVSENKSIWGCYDYEDVDECFRDEPIDFRVLKGVKITDVEVAKDGKVIFYGVIED